MKTNKFSWSEMVSNTRGKTSASGFSGVVLVMVGAVTFFASVVVYLAWGREAEAILIQSIALCYAGAALLGYRKAKDISGEEDSRINERNETNKDI